jgi:NAD(P)-dependent dehydrogenase (short-subunit alcohol dehydrogenase family)
MASADRIVAVVTGSSRGVGKGVALALGGKAATVYVTGRTVKSGRESAAGTIHETAEAVTRAGGKGIAVQCDHRDDSQVKALFGQVETESGRLDLLVNNVAYLHPDIVKLDPFWERSIELADLITVGLRSQYVASYYAAPLLIRQQRGLIANISFYGAVCYFHGPAYGAQKAGVDKMTSDMAVDLKPHNVAVVSVWPGWVATEFAMKVVSEHPEYADQAANFETPQFTGLVIDALFRDPAVMNYSGQALIGAEMAQHYGIRDINGKQPPSYRETMGAPRQAHPGVFL